MCTVQPSSYESLTPGRLEPARPSQNSEKIEALASPHILHVFRKLFVECRHVPFLECRKFILKVLNPLLHFVILIAVAEIVTTNFILTISLSCYFGQIRLVILDPSIFSLIERYCADASLKRKKPPIDESAGFLCNANPAIVQEPSGVYDLSNLQNIFLSNLLFIVAIFG